MLQKNKNATPDQIKTSLCQNAFTDIYTDDAGNEPNYQIGYGKLNSYSSFDHTLPVVLSSFSAVYVPEDEYDEHILISWITQTETDILGFNIYRADTENISQTGHNINASLIDGMGSSTIPTSYEYIDIATDVAASYYYWLEVVNLSGMNDLHGPIEYVPGDIDGDHETDLVIGTILYENFPNPAYRSTTITYQISGSIYEQNVTVYLYNIKGQLIATALGINGKATLSVEALQSGIYFYQIKSDTFNITKKMIVLK